MATAKDPCKWDIRLRKLVRSIVALLWRLKLVIPLARSPSRLEGTPMGVYPKSWRQVMVPEMPVTTLDISALHGFLCWVFDAEVKESCSWLAVVASLLPFYVVGKVGCPWLVWKQNQQFQWYMVFSTDCKKKLLWLRWHQATKIQHCPNTSVNIEIAIKSKCLSLVRPVKHQGQYFGMAHACRTSGLEFSGSSLSCARRGASTTVPTK